MTLQAGARSASKVSVKPGAGVEGASSSGTASGISRGVSSTFVAATSCVGKSAPGVLVEFDWRERVNKYHAAPARRRIKKVNPATRGSRFLFGRSGATGCWSDNRVFLFIFRMIRFLYCTRPHACACFLLAQEWIIQWASHTPILPLAALRPHQGASQRYPAARGTVPREPYTCPGTPHSGAQCQGRARRKALYFFLATLRLRS
jgi:hypothetical protein